MAFAFLFPGQGSQSLNMMSGFANTPTVQATFEEASHILGFDLQAMLETDENAIHETINTQPLMLVASIAIWRTWKKRGGADPLFVAGHSLGEYSALVAASAMDFEDALKLVRLRAELMQNAVPIGQGAMAAILGLDESTVKALCASFQEPVEAVNFNAPGQIVIAGKKEAVEKAMGQAKLQGAKRALLLPVSIPSHSSLMKPASKALEEALASIPLKKPRFRVLHNVDAKSYDEPEKIRQALVDQISQPVLWTHIICSIASQGIECFAECGPGRVLTGLVKRIDERLSCSALINEEAVESALCGFYYL